MKTLTINDITFPVVKRSVYTTLDNGKYIRIPNKKVLINTVSKKPLSIIGNEYEIITNEEAIQYGKSCIKTLFKFKDEKEVDFFNISGPDTLSFCHIDLTSKRNEFTVFGEKFIPFVRITNSYNSMFRLSFKVGVCRYICTNGMIFDEDTIEFTYNHVKGAKKSLNFNVKSDEFEKILDKFKKNVETIRNKELPEKYSFLMFCKALGLSFDLNSIDKSKRARENSRLSMYETQFAEKLVKYKDEVGQNYYALYNVITDFCTYGMRGETLFITRMNSRQLRASRWLSEINSMFNIGGIDYEDYLKDYLSLRNN